MRLEGTRTAGFHFNGVNLAARSKKKKNKILATKSDIGRPSRWDGNVLNAFALGIVNAHPPSGEVDVSLIIEGHAIGSQAAEELLVCEVTVLFNVISIGFTAADICHVKQFAIRCANESIGLFQTIGHLKGLGGSLGKEVNVLPILLHVSRAFPIISGIQGIGKIERSVWPDPEIIGPIECLPFDLAQQSLDLFLWRDGPELVFLIGAGQEVSVGIKEGAIGTP